MISPAFRRIVLGAIAAVGGMDASALDDQVNLQDLGLDSLDLSSVLVEIEEGVGEEVPPAVLDELIELGDLTTVGDVLSALAPWSDRLGAMP